MNRNRTGKSLLTDLKLLAHIFFFLSPDFVIPPLSTDLMIFFHHRFNFFGIFCKFLAVEKGN